MRRSTGEEIVDLYGEKFDFLPYPTSPKLEYMIASVPRSGSTYLAMELWRTGAMGAPLEYLNPPFMEMVRKRICADEDMITYWNKLKRIRSSRNGVFGLKMFITDYLNCGEHHPEVLHEIVPDGVIFITRDNLIQQAVSYSKAIRSGAWFYGVHAVETPTYDAEHIRQCVGTLRYQIDAWNKIFELTKAEVFHITYESMLYDVESVVSGISEFLGVKLNSTTSLEIPKMRVQRNSESLEWAERYKKDMSQLV